MSTTITPIDNDGPRWQPVLGQEVLDFLDRAAPAGVEDSLRDQAVSILSKGVAPTGGPDVQTGLVVGYVQSGKTLSFETVTALARDNEFQLIIVLAGVKTNLLNQTTDRMADDLGVRASRGWVLIDNPRDDNEANQLLRSALDTWADPNSPRHFRRSILITVLKQHQRLSQLTQLLRRIDLSDVAALIVDDEADQVSLNNEVNDGTESTTYTRLMELRSAIPRHNYLQYTATPQAPLLINIIDSLSPNFVEVLDPGVDYCGGKEFFQQNLHLVSIIPGTEVPTKNNPLSEPPDTLLQAMRMFLVGVAAAIALDDGSRHRSMLVHPSHLTSQHRDFSRWITDILDDWRSRINLPDSDPDKQELLDSLREAHADLSKTASDIPPFKDISRLLRIAVNDTQVKEVNTSNGPTPEVPWHNAFAWILVGGGALDRGFTVKGLTVTYMPRGLGTGNADTIQQRARFFGYKRQYLGYCRVFLEAATRDAFVQYVDHEEDIREQLKRFQKSGEPLDHWKRAFVLSSGLKPCRDRVLDFDYMRIRLRGNWVTPRFVFNPGPVVDANRLTASAFLSNFQFSADDGHEKRTDSQRHQLADHVPLRHVLEQLLVPYRVAGLRDTARNTALLLQLNRILEMHPEETCSVYSMSSDLSRDRKVNPNGELSNLFQGESSASSNGPRGAVYPGDRNIRDESRITVQIHRVRLTSEHVDPVSNDTYILAVYIPMRYSADIIVQND
jgi:hypothetical protein